MVVPPPGQQSKTKASPTMKLCLRTAAAAFALWGLLFVSACSTTDGRIKEHQAAFDAAPPDVQAKIKAGQVTLGFTETQVLMAMGEPDRRYTRTTANETVSVWAYRDHKPSFSFGVGMAGGGGGTLVGSGVGISTRGDRNDDKYRVVFSGGRVTALETRSGP